jgi:CubicO group peptidase (beta-lactamase class C family)
VAQLLPAAAPSALGIDATGVIALVDALEADDHDPHSLVLARHGHVAARGWWAPYAHDRVQLVYSLSKSFTATAVGLLVDEGRLSLDDRVFDVIPASELPAGASVPDRYRRLTLGQCLTMATGHDTDAWTEAANAAALQAAAGTDDPVLAAVLAAQPEHEPGTAWAYNQVATYLVGAVVRATTSGSLLGLLRTRLLAPLDPDAPEAARWHLTATGRELGFSGIHVGTDAILGLAQTYLDRGRWQGSQLLSEEWVATATTPTGLPNREPDPNPDWRHGYGCSFWGASHGYRGDGAFGQFAIVLPGQDVALAITSETTDMQGVLDLVWEHLLPAIDRPGDPRADAELSDRMAGLQVPTPSSTSAGPRRAAWVRSADSELPQRYAAGLLTDATGGAGDGWVLDLDVDGVAVPLSIGDGRWRESLLLVDEVVLPVAGAGGWDAAGNFRAELRLIETPHRILVHGRPAGSMRLAWREAPLHGADPATLAVRGRDELTVMPG